MTGQDEHEREHRERRAHMVEAIDAAVADTASCTGIRTLSPHVRRALSAVPRHLFVAAHQAERAYENRPLSIGEGQTISQPFVVAIMTELSGAGPGSRVLEIGTGSGYQAAVLAEVGAEIYSVERIAQLADGARRRLAQLGYERVTVRHGDGSEGWSEHAPYDAIIVTAAAEPGVEAHLCAQLAPRGRLVVPVDTGGGDGLLGPVQELRLLDKDEAGRVHERAVLPVTFVPLVPDRPRPG